MFFNQTIGQRIDTEPEQTQAYINRTLSSIICHASKIRPYAFAYCQQLSTINLDKCISINSNTFYSCNNLKFLDAPVCTSISASGIYHCTTLTEVSLPNCSCIGSSAFQFCSGLTKINLPNARRLSANCFVGCSVLSQLFLPNSSIICNLSSTTCLSQTPMSNSTYLGYYGSIYVPASLYSSYITALYWSVYSSRFVSAAITPTEAYGDGTNNTIGGGYSTLYINNNLYSGADTTTATLCNCLKGGILNEIINTPGCSSMTVGAYNDSGTTFNLTATEDLTIGMICSKDNGYYRSLVWQCFQMYVDNETTPRTLYSCMQDNIIKPLILITSTNSGNVTESIISTNYNRTNWITPTGMNYYYNGFNYIFIFILNKNHKITQLHIESGDTSVSPSFTIYYVPTTTCNITMMPLIN